MFKQLELISMLNPDAPHVYFAGRFQYKETYNTDVSEIEAAVNDGKDFRYFDKYGNHWNISEIQDALKINN